MTLTELRAAVYEITNRPDMVSRTLLAIQTATLKAHQTDFYTKDLFETGIVFDESLTNQQILYKDLLPRWRAAKYFRKFDATALPAPGAAVSGQGAIFTRIVPELVFDSYDTENQDVWYSAGDVIHLKSYAAFQNILCGCYLNPDVTEANFSSWIAVDFPQAIYLEAAATVFRMIGKGSESRDYIAMAGDARNDVSKTGILDYGY